MSPSTDRQTFRETVALVAAKAKATLPEAVNGRIESAVKLVLAHDVTVLDDGSIEVGSASDPLKTYTLAGSACDCQDFAYGKAPGGWCQHRIAAGIQKRVRELLPVVPDTDPEGTPPPPPMETEPSPAPAVPPAQPEAPASCNVYVTISGHKVQVTLRDRDEHRMLARLQTLLQQYPAQAPASPQGPTQGAGQLSPQQFNALAQHRPVQGVCPVHQVEMKQNHGKDGRSWWSHYDEQAGRWCKGK